MNITYETYAVLVKSIRPEHCVKRWSYTARRRQILRRRGKSTVWRKTASSEDDGFKIRHDPYIFNCLQRTYILIISIPDFLRPFPNLYMALSVKCKNLNLRLKTWYKRGIQSAMWFFCPTLKCFCRQPVVWRKSSGTHRHTIFFTEPKSKSSRARLIPGEPI